jgi:membrane associated rhomboid family serine protease
MRFSSSFLGGIPPVVKNLLILNTLMLLLTYIIEYGSGIDLKKILGLYYFASPNFHPFQIITHMFMHDGIMHLVLNMYALWMFGSILETKWGGKRLFVYYFITGLGAAFLYVLVNYIQIQNIIAKLEPADVDMVLKNGAGIIAQEKNYMEPLFGKLNLLINMPVVGASGAIFGLLLAFGMLFPNVPLMLIFFPVPIKAKYFVLGYGLIELYSGLMNSPGDNVAHFAHLGGMIFGFILIKIWAKTSPPTGKFF